VPHYHHLLRAPPELRQSEELSLGPLSAVDNPNYTRLYSFADADAWPRTPGSRPMLWICPPAPRERNVGLILARMLGWRRLMFLDDDIYDDLAEWRRYLTKLDRLDSIGSAFEHLDLDYAESPFPSSR
jgi:hypothetical protein